MLFEAKDIAVSYSRAGEVIPLFSEVTFTLEKGAIYDLVGSSGSGKSTLLRVCARMLQRNSGQLFLEGKESSSYTPTQWRRLVCLVPQIPALIPGTVYDNLIFPWKLKVHRDEALPTKDMLREYLAQASLSDVELERDSAQLSGGQVARIALLRVLATKPRVLLLDEVDAALDDASAHAIGVLINEMVGNDFTCLRIRHRAADGFAKGTYTLQSGALTYCLAAKDTETLS